MSDIQSPETHDPLSDAGQQRRDQMLPRLQGAMQDWHRRRRRQRRAALAIIPLLFITLSVIWSRMSSVPTPPKTTPVAINSDNPAPTSAPDTHVPRQVLVIDRIATDPNILDRFTIDAHASIEIIDDDSLLSLLAEMDRPTGLITTEGEIRLTRNVVDPLAPSPPPGS